MSLVTPPRNLRFAGFRFREQDFPLSPQKAGRLLIQRASSKAANFRAEDGPLSQERKQEIMVMRWSLVELAEPIDGTWPEMRLRLPAGAKIKKALMDVAQTALNLADPVISKFRVGAGALVGDGKGDEWIVGGWNVEFVNGDAIHAEENIIAKLRPGEKILAIVVVGGGGEHLTPCGNCREVLMTKASTSPEAQIYLKTQQREGWITVKRLLPDYSKLYTDNPQNLLAYDSLRPAAKEMIKAVLARPKSAYPFYARDKGTAALLFEDGVMLSISSREDAAFHPEHSIEATLSAADLQREKALVTVVYEGEGDFSEPLLPCGRCRQKLFEAAQVSGVEEDMEIILFSPKRNHVFITTIGELLPYAFAL